MLGWAALGTGVVLASYSLYDYFIKDGANGTWELEPLFFVGGSLIVASVPCFILARHNKVKAGLALKRERLSPSLVLSKPYYPALSLQIRW